MPTVTPTERTVLVASLAAKVAELCDCAVVCGALPHEVLCALDGVVEGLEREKWRTGTRGDVVAAIEGRYQGAEAARVAAPTIIPRRDYFEDDDPRSEP